MTVSTTIIKNSYSGDGSQHSFAYGFKIFADADLDVIIRSSTGVETVKVLDTDYVVTNAGNDSGGNVLFKYNTGNTGDAHYSATDKRPQSGETIVIRRSLDKTQSTDYVANDPFPAESHEDALDRLTFISQEIQEETDRSIKLSRTNTMTSTEFTVGATDRANKVLAFDSSGEISVTQELGIYKGTDATTTTAAYVQRDIIKSTTAAQLNNVYICVADSVVGDLLTDTDHFELLIDAVTAATSATNAASSASAAATSETNAATSESNAATSETNAATSESNASTSETNAAASATSASNSATSAASSATTATTKASEASTSATNAATSETNAATSESNAGTSETNAATSATTATTKASEAATSATNASTSETNAASSATTATTKASEASTSATNAATSETNASNSATSAASSATTATTKASEASTSASNAATSESNASTSASNAATSATNAATSETNAATSATTATTKASEAATSASNASTSATAAQTAQTAAEAAQSAAETAADNFDDTYLGAKSSDPSVDNDGDALSAGDLYFNTTQNKLKVYTGSVWADAAITASDFLTVANNLSDLNNAGTARTNLGLGTAATSASTDFVAVTGDAMTGNLTLGDNNKAIFGTDSDLQIYHDGSASRIDDTGTGNLILRGSGAISLQKYTGEILGQFTADGSVTLYHDNSPKLATKSDGVDITGELQTDTLDVDGTSNFADDITLVGASIAIGDNEAVRFGAGQDLTIFHDAVGGGSYINESGGGNLIITGTNIEFKNTGSTSTLATLVNGGAVNLYYNGSKKFETSSSGVTVTGTITSDGIVMGDNEEIQLGNSTDLRIYHDGSNSIIRDAGTGNLQIQADDFKVMNASGTENVLFGAEDGVVRLFYNNATKFETTSDGVYVTGNVQSSSGAFEGASDQDKIVVGASQIDFYINNSNEFRMESDGDFHADRDVIAYSTTVSDERLKTDIEKIENATDKVSQLNGYTFTYKADGKKSAGVIAQEVEKVLPSAVSEKELPLKTDDGVAYKTVQYDQIIGLLIESIKELKQEINELKGV